ncbi:MAG: hypothetical protein HQK63_13370 [Desulfamplus sp.]|nr:hypothetical protein [Desulfamplus sp.]
MTLADILQSVRRLQAIEKLKLIRILAEELDMDGNVFPFERNKTYCLPTPYNIFGVAEILMNTLENSDTRK